MERGVAEGEQSRRWSLSAVLAEGLYYAILHTV